MMDTQLFNEIESAYGEYESLLSAVLGYGDTPAEEYFPQTRDVE